MIILLIEIRIKPPTISAARNCQPRKIIIRIPSSITRLVEANMNATAAIKCAPFFTKARAAANAAKEQEEEAAPKNVLKEMLLKSASPIYLVILPFGTKACIMPETK